MTAEQIVDNPVRPVGAGDLQGFPRGHLSTAFSEQIHEFPNPGGSRQDFQPVQGSAASSSDLPGQAGQGVFSHFSQREKSATLGPHLESELLPEASPSTPAAQLEDFFTVAAGVWMRFPGCCWKLLGSDPEVWRPG